MGCLGPLEGRDGHVGPTQSLEIEQDALGVLQEAWLGRSRCRLKPECRIHLSGIGVRSIRSALEEGGIGGATANYWRRIRSGHVERRGSRYARHRGGSQDAVGIVQHGLRNTIDTR